MSTVLTTILWAVLLIAVVLAGFAVVVLRLAAPTARRVFEQQRLEQERRVAEWKVAQATQHAMSQLLEEARRAGRE